MATPHGAPGGLSVGPEELPGDREVPPPHSVPWGPYADCRPCAEVLLRGLRTPHRAEEARRGPVAAPSRGPAPSVVRYAKWDDLVHVAGNALSLERRRSDPRCGESPDAREGPGRERPWWGGPFGGAKPPARGDPTRYPGGRAAMGVSQGGTQGCDRGSRGGPGGPKKGLHLSRLGELLNTQKNVHFLAPPGGAPRGAQNGWYLGVPPRAPKYTIGIE